MKMKAKMSDWKSYLKADPTEWLLEDDNPSVKYFTLKDILGKPEKDAVVTRAKKEIMKTGTAPRILEKQAPGGYWGKAEDFYERSKYRGTVWQFIILGELGVDAKDKRVVKACEFILKHSRDPKSGGFSYMGNRSGGIHGKVIPCLTGNMLCSLIRFGYLEDPRVRQGIEWIVKYQRFDDKVKEAPQGWPYSWKQCWGRHTCHMGVVKNLKALSEIPVNKRTRGVKETIEKAAEYLLKHHIYKRSHNLEKVSKEAWLKFGFPLMWKDDALEILGILTRLGYKDKRMQEAVDLLISKQDEQGRWKLESTFNGKFLVNIEQEGKPSKWVTLNALRVLKRIYD